jgi:hypothetical protein
MVAGRNSGVIICGFSKCGAARVSNRTPCLEKVTGARIFGLDLNLTLLQKGHVLADNPFVNNTIASLYRLPVRHKCFDIVMGRPRVKGQKLASPQEVVAKTAERTRLTVAWYGGTMREIEVATGKGHWYRIGEMLVEVRWVYVHDCTGTHRDEYFFTTDLSMCPKRIVECYTQRWSIETTFQECREYLKLESPKAYGQRTVLLFASCLFGLYTIVVLLYLQLPQPLKYSSCSLLERQSNGHVLRYDDLCTPADPQEFSKLSPS